MPSYYLTIMALDRWYQFFKNSALLGGIDVFNGFPQPQYLGFSDRKKNKMPPLKPD